jgi:hypothetical protein
MADMRPFRLIDLLLLLLVFSLAMGARAAYLVTCADNGLSEGPIRVQDRRPDAPGPFEEGARGLPRPTELDVLIEQVQKNGQFRCQPPFAAEMEPTAHVSPGYAYCLALLGRYLPVPNTDQVVRWIQAVLGAISAVLYFLFARRAFRSLTVGTLAGVLTALHPFWILATPGLEDGILASFLLAVVLFLSGQAGEKGGALTSLLLGVSLAGLALVRATLLPFSFVALVWFLLRSQTVPRGWLCALLSFLGFAIGLSSWTVRNYQIYQEPVPIVSSVYLHLWIGNNPQATGGPATPAMWKHAPAAELREITNQPARYARLARPVVEEITTQPAQTIRRRLMAGLMFLFGERFFSDGRLAEVSTSGEELPAWLQASYPIALPATLLGLLGLALLGWRWSWPWHWESIPAALAVMWLPLPYLLSHAEALSGPRLPLDGPLLCFAAYALGCLVPGVAGPLFAGPVSQPEPEPEAVI